MSAPDNDIDKIDHLIDSASELVLPSMDRYWHLRSGCDLANRAMIEAKGDIIRSMQKLERAKGLVLAAVVV